MTTLRDRPCIEGERGRWSPARPIRPIRPICPIRPRAGAPRPLVALALAAVFGFLAPALRAAEAPAGAGWKPLFDGKSLGSWKPTEFGGTGEVRVEKSFRGGPPAILVEMGVALNGFHWTGEVPRTNYEIALEAMKIDGNDFACGLTFPVGDSHASLILGGWGGGIVGISSINDLDASENETTKVMNFPPNRWFKVRMRVTKNRLQAWLDEKPIVDQDITGKKISLRRGDISRQVPLGISTFQTTAAFREIRLRKVEP